MFWPVTRQDIQKEVGCHVGLPGSWPKKFGAESSSQQNFVD